MTFAGDLSGKAVVKHHDDRPPSTYHAIEIWVYSDTDKRYNAAIADNFGGIRDFASPGWQGDALVWSSEPSIAPAQQFAYKKLSAESFAVEWRVMRKGIYVVGDTLKCTRVPATPQP